MIRMFLDQPLARLAPRFLCAVAFLAVVISPVAAQDPLANGKKITPLGTQFGVGSLPMNMIASSDGRYAVVSDMGERESLWSLYTDDGAGVSHVDFVKSSRWDSNGLYYGLVIDKDGTIYASQGAAHKIAVVKLASDGSLTQSGFLATAPTDFPAGLALDSRGDLYVVNKEYYSGVSDDIKTGSTPSSLAIYSTTTGTEVGRISLPAQEITSASGPLTPPQSAFAVAAFADGSRVFVTSQRDGVVYAIDSSAASSPKLLATVATGSHPDSL